MLLKERFGMDPSKFGNMHSFMLCSPHIQTEEELGSIAILGYGLYITTNRLRIGQRQDLVNEHDRVGAVIQSTKEAVKGHKRATQIFRCNWVKDYVSEQLEWPKEIWTPPVQAKRRCTSEAEVRFKRHRW